MTVANQNMGFNPERPMMRGDDHAVRSAIAIPVEPEDWDSPITATYVWLEDEPRDGLVQSPLFAIAKASMTFELTTTGITVTIPIPSSMTSGLFATTYYHQLRLISESGKVAVPFTGLVKLTAGA